MDASPLRFRRACLGCMELGLGDCKGLGLSLSTSQPWRGVGDVADGTQWHNWIRASIDLEKVDMVVKQLLCQSRGHFSNQGLC